MRAGQAGLTAANSTPTLSATWRPHGQGDRHSTGRHTGTPPRPVSCPSPPPGDAFPCTLAPQDRPPPPSTPASSSPAQPLPPPCRLLRCCLHPNSLGRLWEAPPPTDCWLHPVGSSRSSSSKGAWTGASPRSLREALQTAGSEGCCSPGKDLGPKPPPGPTAAPAPQQGLRLTGADAPRSGPTKRKLHCSQRNVPKPPYLFAVGDKCDLDTVQRGDPLQKRPSRDFISGPTSRAPDRSSLLYFLKLKAWVTFFRYQPGHTDSLS